MSHSVKLIRGAFTFLLLSVFISSGVSIASAAAYNAGTRTGDVSCTGGGNFTVVSGVVEFYGWPFPPFEENSRPINGFTFDDFTARINLSPRNFEPTDDDK